MCGILGPTAGETWLAYIGVPDDYPDRDLLARMVDDAMWDAALDVLRDEKARDPLLRAMADERCRLWDVYTCPAGTLPVGTHISITKRGTYTATFHGQLRAPDRYERERAFGSDNELYVHWTSRVGEWPHGWGWPTVSRTTEVDAVVPVPFDLSALLAVIDAEDPPAPAPKRRPPARRARKRRTTT
jgi:hypothetical protein